MSTVKLAQFISETDERKIPKEAFSLAKRAVLDYTGVALAGSNEPAVSILSEYVKQMGASTESGVIGRGFGTSAELAAWVNGTSGHVLDYDDTDSIASGYNMHPSVPILPAVFALGEKSQASGRDLLAAYVIGFEVEARLGAVIGAVNSESGWHPTSVLGTMAAAAASARILRLKREEAQIALGIAASLTNGLMRNFGTMTKPMHAGNAARHGVVSALLAQRGFTATPDITEGEFGYCHLFSSGKVCGMEERDLDLGEIWNIVTIGFAFKPYPSCRDTHGCVDAALDLRKKYDIAADQIASVICHVSSKQARILRFSNPRNGTEARFSMPYCIGTALLRGRLALEDFEDERVFIPEVKNLLPKIRLVPLERGAGETSPSSQEVIIKLKNGAEYARQVAEPKGDPRNPMSDEELIEKFREGVKERLKTEKVEAIIKSIMTIDQLSNIRELAERVTYP
jgi:2-methylcitrate dehydratase PrpD